MIQPHPPVRTVSRAEIEKALDGLDLVPAIEQAFVAYSQGRAVIPPVGELLFDDPPGDAHIKYGRLIGDDVFVIKVATGFYDNPRRGLPPTSGLMLVFDARTGFPSAALLDDGELTNLRTAAAGAVAAKHLARPDASVIGVLGSGQQARLQAQMLRGVTSARRALVWARRPEAAASTAADLAAMGFDAETRNSPSAVALEADLIVTTTASTEPLLAPGDLRHGTHVTAMGSDTPDKQELAGGLVAAADVVVADSLPQCRERGEIRHALDHGLDAARVIELGAVIAGDAPGRSSSEQITIADLTGVAVQDIAIAKAVLAGLDREHADGR